jgi:hypothetical protein
LEDAEVSALQSRSDVLLVENVNVVGSITEVERFIINVSRIYGLKNWMSLLTEVESAELRHKNLLWRRQHFGQLLPLHYECSIKTSSHPTSLIVSGFDSALSFLTLIPASPVAS